MSFKSKFENLLNSAMNQIGEDIVYKPSKGGSFPVRGIFDSSYKLIDSETGGVISGNHAKLGLKNSDLPFEVLEEDRFIVNGRTFKVKDIQEDGQGGILIELIEKVFNAL